MIDVSVVIINYKTPQMCCDCIESLLEHTKGVSFEIIVIDNNSQDNSAEIISKYSDIIQFIQNEENLGTARAFNQGASISKGKYVFFLNTDTLFINDAITELFSFMEKHDNVAVTGPNFYNSNRKPTHSFRKHFFKMKYFKRDSFLLWIVFKHLFARILCYEFNYTNHCLKVDYVCAAGTLMRKDVYQAIGGFNEKIFIYGDEALYAYNCYRKGYLSYNVPTAKIIHFEGDSFKKNHNGFSKGRVIRYLDGMSIHISEIYGEDKIPVYYAYYKKALKKRVILYKVLNKTQKVSELTSEIETVDEYVKSKGY